MNSSLEKEVKSLSIMELNDLVNYMKKSKSSLFSPRLKYEKNSLPTSNISSVSLLKRWITGISKKNNDLRKTYINDFMVYYDFIVNTLDIKINNLKESSEASTLEDLNNKCGTYLSIIKLLGSDEDYLDRLGFSVVLYDIKTSDDESVINNSINNILTSLSKIGIVITPKDFNFITYVYNYMVEYYKLIDNEDSSVNNKLREYLDKYKNFNKALYLTLLSILYKNKDLLIKYLNKQIVNKLDNVQSDKNDIFTKYFKTRREYINLLGNDDLTILDYFKNNPDKLNIYREDSIEIKEIIDEISNLNVYSKYTPEEKVFYSNNLIEFYWDLAEYKFVNDYKQLFNYGEILITTKFKKHEFNNLLQAIKVLTKRLNRANSRLIKETNKLNKVLIMDSSKFYKVQNNVNKYSYELDELIDDLIDLISSYDNLKLIKNIHDNINEKSTIYDVLKVLNNNYNVLRKLTNDDINSVLEMEYFHHLSLLDNIYFKHITSIKYLIEQKYNLYNISCPIPDSSSEEFEELRDKILILMRYLSMLNKKLTIDDIKIVLDYKD